MTLYDSSTKVFLIGDMPSELKDRLMSADGICSYSVFPISQGSKQIKVSMLDDATDKPTTEPLEAPASGISIIVAADKNDATLQALLQIWEQAGLQQPPIIQASDNPNIYADILSRLVAAQHTEIENACRRNVDLRGQIAILREEIEQANIQLSDMSGLLAKTHGGIHNLLWKSDVDLGFSTLNPGETATQKLPLTISPWRLSAVSILMSSNQHQTARVRLTALEDDSTLCEWSANIPAGASWLMLPLKESIPNKYQLIALEITNDESNQHAIEIARSRALNPDEMVHVNSQEQNASLMLKIWGDGKAPGADAKATAATSLFEAKTPSAVETVKPDKWINKAVALSQISKPPKWFGQFDNYLRVHPSTEAVAAARTELQAETPISGLLIDFELANEDAQAVQFCIAASDVASADVSARALAQLASQDVNALKQHASISTTGWITALPGTAVKSVPVYLNKPAENISLYFLTRVTGSSAGNCHAHFQNLRFIHDRD